MRQTPRRGRGRRRQRFSPCRLLDSRSPARPPVTAEETDFRRQPPPPCSTRNIASVFRRPLSPCARVFFSHTARAASVASPFRSAVTVRLHVTLTFDAFAFRFHISICRHPSFSAPVSPPPSFSFHAQEQQSPPSLLIVLRRSDADFHSADF